MFFKNNPNSLVNLKLNHIDYFGKYNYTQFLLDLIKKSNIEFDRTNKTLTIEQLFLKTFGVEYLIKVLKEDTFKIISKRFEIDTNKFLTKPLKSKQFLYLSGIPDMKIENSDLLNKPLKDKLFSKIRATINNVPSEKRIFIGFKIAIKIEKLHGGDTNFRNIFTKYIFEPNLTTSKTRDNKNNYYFMDKINLLKEIYNHINEIYSKREQKYFQIFIFTEKDDKTTPPQIFEELQKAA
jgi:hypothetical protein